MKTPFPRRPEHLKTAKPPGGMISAIPAAHIKNRDSKPKSQQYSMAPKASWPQNTTPERREDTEDANPKYMGRKSGGNGAGFVPPSPDLH